MSGNVDDFFKMLKFGFEGCALAVGLIALPFVIAAHNERCKKRATAMSAKARELSFEFPAFAKSRLARMVWHTELPTAECRHSRRTWRLLPVLKL